MKVVRRFCVTNYLKTAIVAILAEAEAGKQTLFSFQNAKKLPTF